MPIPKQFRLKGKLWKVKLVKDLTHEDGTKCFGICDTDARVIELKSNQSYESKFSAFLHELCHAMIHEAHIPDNVVFTDGIEDIFCEAFADLFTSDFEVSLMEVHNE